MSKLKAWLNSRSSEDREYFIRQIIKSIADLDSPEKRKRLRDFLTDFNFIETKVFEINIQELLEDYDLAPSPESDPIILLQRALQLSAQIINQDKTQLAGQLIGRLAGFDAPEIQSFLEQAKQWKETYWLRPISSTLISPGSSLQRILEGHTDSVNAITFTPNGQRVISASSDGSLKIWDWQRGVEEYSLTGHTDRVNALTVTPDGQQVISASNDGTIRVWDLETGKPVLAREGGTRTKTRFPWQIAPNTGVTAISVSPNNQYAVSTASPSEKNIRVWDIQKNWTELFSLSGHIGQITAVDVTSDGRVISASNFMEPNLRIWDLKEKKQLSTLRGHSGGINALVLTPDEQRVISASDDQTLRVWNLKTEECLYILEGHSGGVNSVAIFPDGQRIISASDDNMLKIWDLTEYKELSSIPGDGLSIAAVVVLPDGQHFISASGNSLKVFNIIKEIEQVNIKGHTREVSAVVAVPDKQLAISASLDGTIKGWNLENGLEWFTAQSHKRGIFQLAISSDLKSAISASLDGTIKGWNSEDGLEQFCLNGHTGAIQGFAIASNGQRLISAASDNTLKVWDLVNSQAMLTLNGKAWTKLRLSQQWSNLHNVFAWFLENGKKLIVEAVGFIISNLVVGSKETAVISSELGEYQRLLQSLENSINSKIRGITAVAVTPDGQYALSTANKKTLKAWNLNTGKALFTLHGHNDRVNIVVIPSSNGRLAISAAGNIGSSNDCTLIVWDLNRFDKLYTLRGHKKRVNAVIVSSNGKYAVSASSDNTVRVWSLENGKLLHILRGHTDKVNGINISPDNKLIISVSSDRTIKIWNLEQGNIIANFTTDDALQSCCFASDGNTIIIGSKQGKIHFFQLVEGNSSWSKISRLNQLEVDEEKLSSTSTKLFNLALKLLPILANPKINFSTKVEDMPLRIDLCRRGLNLYEEMALLTGRGRKDTSYLLQQPLYGFLQSKLAVSLLLNSLQNPNELEEAISIFTRLLSIFFQYPEDKVLQPLKTPYQKVVLEYSRFDWALINKYLGIAYLKRTQGDRLGNLRESIDSFKAALDFFDSGMPWKHFHEWASSQHGLYLAYLSYYEYLNLNKESAIVANGEERLIGTDQIITNDVLSNVIFPIIPIPFQKSSKELPIKLVNLGLNYLYYYEHLPEDRNDIVEQSIKCLQTAKLAFHPELHRQEWIATQTGLGLAYYRRTQGDRRENLRQVVSTLQSTLSILNLDSFPEEYSEIQECLESANSELDRNDVDI